MAATFEEEDKLKLPKEILAMGPSYLKYLLMKPTQTTISYITAVFCTILRGCLICLSLILLPQAQNIMMIAEVVAGASAFTQGLKSAIPIVFYKKEISWLISQGDRYWPTNDETKDIETFYKKVIGILNSYKRLIFVTYTAYVPVALIMHKLPFLTWIPPIQGGYYLIYIIQFTLLTFDATLVCSADSFFVGTCSNIYAQFQILHNRMKNLGTGNLDLIDKEIAECVRHHNFLLNYTNVLINVFSIGLVFQFFVTTYSLCIEILVFTRRDAVGMSIGIIYCSMLTCQLALYCFPADAVIEISHQCANAIYDCPWYEHDRKLKHIVMNCMQRAQKRLIFTAGGFIDIDKAAFTKIFKGIMSLNTLMKNIFE